jgi:hypothetical protein
MWPCVLNKRLPCGIVRFTRASVLGSDQTILAHRGRCDRPAACRDGAVAPSMFFRFRTEADRSLPAAMGYRSSPFGGPRRTSVFSPAKSIKKSRIDCLFVDRSQEVHVMQPRQLARVRPLGKLYCVAKLIVGPKAPVIDCWTVTYFLRAPALNYGDTRIA